MHTAIVTLSAIAGWAMLSVVSRVLIVNLGLDPWLFSFLQLIAGGLALLLIGFPAAGRLGSFARVSTWVLGAFRVLSAALYTAALALISVLEVGIISAINLPVVAIFIWYLSGTRPQGLAWVGHMALLLAVAIMASRLESGLQITVLTLLGLNAICLAAMNLIAERHPENAGSTPAGRAWFSGVVLVITATLFLGFRLAQGGSLAGIMNAELLLASVFVGVLLRAPSMFMTFWAIRLARAQGYTAAISFLPFFGLAFEQASVWMGVLEVSRFQWANAGIAVLALSGTLLVWVSNRAKP